MPAFQAAGITDAMFHGQTSGYHNHSHSNDNKVKVDTERLGMFSKMHPELPRPGQPISTENLITLFGSQ